MDAHLFRRFCSALIPGLSGARMEKIHAPAPGLIVFTLYGGRGGDGKRFLTLRSGRSSPLLFVSDHRVPVNAQPPAFVMRLRKHLSGERVVRAVCHWTARRLWLGFSGLSQPWLCLDLREGPSLGFEAPPPPEEPLWPSALPTDPDAWRGWDVLTPALRRTLPHLDPLDAAALLADLEAGDGDVFLYENDDGRCEVSAWPLPPAQLESLKGHWRETACADPLTAMSRAGEQVYGALSEQARLAAARPFSAEAARLERLLKKLDAEEQRLSALRARQKDALLLQSQLYRFDAREKRAHVTLDSPEGPVVLPLDGSRTVRENILELFRQAGRGRRGLEHLALRREAVREEKARAEAAALRSLAAVNGTSLPANTPQLPRQSVKAADPGLPRQVQAFRSSDGFLILRGRDSKGNGLVLKLAAPHDYWLHTADGPGAHVIIRRDHSAQDVPERTLLEAGALAALKSWQKYQERAEIQYALARFIHPMKNAAPGTVRIDRSEGAFRVTLDPDLEQRLESH